MNMQIIMEDPQHLSRHALHIAIYGQESISALIENIRDVGIQTPLLITQDHRIISGYRRWQAAINLGLPTVPVQISSLTEEDDIAKMLILSNKDNRERTAQQKAKEVQQLKALNKGRNPVKNDEKTECLQNEDISPEHKTNEDPHITIPSHDRDWTQKVGEQLGISPSKAYRLDYTATAIDQLTANGKTQEAEAVRVALNKSEYAGYQKARELKPPKPQTRNGSKQRKETKAYQQARILLGKNMPTRATITPYDLMIKLWDKLTRSERADFLAFAQVQIQLRVLTPKPPAETRH